MGAALIWLGGGVVLIAAEVLSGDLWLLMVGIGALCGAIAAWAGAEVVLSAGVFALASIALVTVARPWLKNKLQTIDYKTNVDALIGAKAIVLSVVDSNRGEVKIGGEIWTARTFGDGEKFDEGDEVTVIQIAGATAVVSDSLRVDRS
ncbi:membrane protein implicated in regulation of membrane protease activity [Herbihabitans rhizosphaerae]|uniref:Membrane protein implicated in regulation of membrane protease activity n=1 Tax=Herbihabitans rhizosphaerae TaxID=1872711 RepID=A0A4V2EU87_9PSEU|nr:NfeD family protein [Herbihabitans rhizosphaerae]RZS43713.1 membrane protein implicated in regulation of membrane protease activity [Herbihabitans rhizosphaerae]